MAAYHQAMDSRSADVTPLATLCLGLLMEKQGDVNGAKAAYQHAIEVGSPDIVRLATDAFEILTEES
jgi:hypothetical protein